MGRGDVLLACLIFVVLVMIGLGVHNKFNRSDWAAWVQAVGSIAALGVAIFIMARQSAHAAKLLANADHIALVRRATSVEVLVRNAGATILSTFTHLRQDQSNGNFPQLTLNNVEIWLDTLIDARKALESVPIYELGSPELVHAALEMLDDLAHVINCLNDWKQAGMVPDPDVFQMLANYYPADNLKSYKNFGAGVRKLQQE